MSNITIEHLEGVGVNSRYGVFRYGKPVAYIQRSGHAGSEVFSILRNEVLARCKTIAHAKRVALVLVYSRSNQP